MEQFIREYPNVLNDSLIDHLIDLVDKNQTWRGRADKHRKDKQFPLEPFWPEISTDINKQLIQRTLGHYLREFPVLTDDTDVDWTSGITILQKTSPCEGYHSFHCENMGWTDNARAIAWMIYLNDVEGGETEWLYQQKKIKPQRNLAVLWPGSWTHLHRGNPPMSDKYILTGWYTPTTSFPKFKINEL